MITTSKGLGSTAKWNISYTATSDILIIFSPPIHQKLITSRHFILILICPSIVVCIGGRDPTWCTQICPWILCVCMRVSDDPTTAYSIKAIIDYEFANKILLCTCVLDYGLECNNFCMIRCYISYQDCNWDC